MIERIGEARAAQSGSAGGRLAAQGAQSACRLHVSPIQFARPGFARGVIDAVQAADVDRLCSRSK